MTKTEAAEKAVELKNMMKSPGWKVRVWENMGWHYSIYNGNLAVYPSFVKGTYHANLSDSSDLLSWHNNGDKVPSGTPSYWHKAETFKDPNEAVASQVKRARAFVNQLQLVVTDAECISDSRA
jgi:hypothetical protein